MHFHEVLKMIFAGFKANKIRSGLTVLGIVIGIGSVIVIMSVGAGAQSLILNQIKSAGSNLIGILPGASDEKGPPASAFGLAITTLKYEDAEALANKDLAPHLIAVSAYVQGVDSISSAIESITSNFMGVSASYLDVEDTDVAMGRFFTYTEEKGLTRLAVLGSQIKKDLFGDQNPLGQRIKIKRENFEVVGVMKGRGSSMFTNQDSQVFIPVTTAQKILLGINHLGFIRAKADDAANLDRSIEDIKTILRQRHHLSSAADDDFTVRTTAQALDVLGSVTDALRFFLAGIGALSLLVGGVGIMNIMLIAVAERTREIGLRKAVGARKKDLLTHFLTEATILAFIGGLIGIGLGVTFSALIAVVARALGYQWDLVISPLSIVLASIVSISIGLIFGYYPAHRAAVLDPIRALRYE